ncbi:MAG: hypothetical protein RL701_1582 [Pseudomonadota bacterium]
MNSNELFGGEATPEIKRLVDATKQAPAWLQSEMLWTIQMRAPECLPIYYLLYKMHATRREFIEAERAAVLGLAQAGKQSGLPGDALVATRAALPAVDFMNNGPARFWLFTLKALAYIRLRSGRREQARVLLDCIHRCDPTQSIGTDVIAALIAAASD